MIDTSERGFLLYAEMQCLHYHISRRLTRMHTTRYRLWMSHMHRLSLHLVCGCRLDALWALHAQAMLYIVHGNRIQVPDLQKECREDGLAMAQIDVGNRGPAHAGAIREHPSDCPMQRLLKKVFGQVSLAG